jgi:hypothetical protein
MRTVPFVGRMRPEADCKSVVFPEPEGPMIAVNVARANVRLSASSAATLLPFEPYTIETASTSTAAH